MDGTTNASSVSDDERRKLREMREEWRRQEEELEQGERILNELIALDRKPHRITYAILRWLRTMHAQYRRELERRMNEAGLTAADLDDGTGADKEQIA